MTTYNSDALPTPHDQRDAGVTDTLEIIVVTGATTVNLSPPTWTFTNWTSGATDNDLVIIDGSARRRGADPHRIGSERYDHRRDRCRHDRRRRRQRHRRLQRQDHSSRGHARGLDLRHGFGRRSRRHGSSITRTSRTSSAGRAGDTLTGDGNGQHASPAAVAADIIDGGAGVGHGRRRRWQRHDRLRRDRTLRSRAAAHTDTLRSTVRRRSTCRRRTRTRARRWS